MRADLHIHTTASDGCWSPERVVAEVKVRAIGLFAVADHDTVAGVSVAEALARREGLAFLRGVEVSTRLDGQVFHILGYGFDPQSPALVALLHENRLTLDRASDEAIQSLIAAGYPIDPADYAAYTYDRTRGGWKAYNFLVDRGLCSGIRDYFDRLGPAMPPDPPPFVSPAEAIAVIRQAGGVPVLAHPGASFHPQVTGEGLRMFLDLGIAGVECYSYAHDEATTRFCLDWCARRNLLITGGSDCHGGLVPRELGIPPVDTAALRLGELEACIVGGL
jgi:predicted metal-dependent phosphoesterase TrpH